MRARTIVVLGTGGTIAGSAADASDHLGYQAGTIGVQALLGAVPFPPGWECIAAQVAQVDSKDMELSIWKDLALRCDGWLARPEVAGVVITHGTDTLEETAYFLHRVLAPSKPVVLTCAMRPASALSPDGPQNLADALVVASTPGVQGVLAVCAGTVHLAQDVAKVHPYRLDAFDSGDAGPAARIEDGRLRQLRAWAAADLSATARLAQVRDAVSWPRVDIVMSHAGADGLWVQAARDAGARGLVVAGTGNGTVHQALEAALVAAQAAGMRVLRSTRCSQGRVLPHAGDRLESHPLSPVKARVDLLLECLA